MTVRDDNGAAGEGAKTKMRAGKMTARAMITRMAMRAVRKDNEDRESDDDGNEEESHDNDNEEEEEVEIPEVEDD